MEHTIFLIFFIILVLIVAVYLPVSGYFEVKKLKKSIADGNSRRKIEFYRATVFWSWIPIFLIFILMAISDIPLESIGIKWIDIEAASAGKWIVFPTIAFYCLYLIYNIYSIIIFKYNKNSRARATKSIPAHFKSFLPITREEKRLWDYVSVTAGITEEILYRGYFFYALGVIFPGLSLIHILLITTIMFGLGHIYLGKEVIRPTILGLFFGIFYIIFDSVFPVIIIHIAQDLVVRDLFDE
ncbi:CPBP family intramembrane metalloprotease [Leptobacterium flavescens]|uniref:CPBP family intramembrane metalloprotease n=1 Tax=Leptobacterium flavescens TaxID=472055 RepID=A0A6P0UFT5_9FLAO|nr:CPBP family intramembrane glutamic endopeptidase [Leptobacterium flavescens]NER12095.1 CPBP family intramembrane metalloprotease [Leptobacterium flavescens]